LEIAETRFTSMCEWLNFMDMKSHIQENDQNGDCLIASVWVCKFQGRKVIFSHQHFMKTIPRKETIAYPLSSLSSGIWNQTTRLHKILWNFSSSKLVLDSAYYTSQIQMLKLYQNPIFWPHLRIGVDCKLHLLVYETLWNFDTLSNRLRQYLRPQGCNL